MIGSYSWDGSHIFYDLDTQKIYRCEQESSVILNSWNGLRQFLSHEITRLSKLFNENGIEYDEDIPTTP